MRPYWLKTEMHRLGVGITANSEDDAIIIYRLTWPDTAPEISISAITDMRELDQNHVAPNMGNCFKRGIWYPLGYDQISN